MADFSGKSVLITGGSSGTGAHLALAFAAAGADVKITGRREEALLAVCEKSPSKMQYQIADVSKEDEAIAMFADGGPYQIVIANAGVSASAPLKKQTLEDWNHTMAINATGVFLTLREGLKQMQAGGRLIVLSSILGKYGAPYTAAYCASKHATLGLVKSVAHEVAKLDITINAICPGYIETEMTERTVENIRAKTGLSREEAVASLTHQNPQGRLITCEEVTHTALYLASEGASSVNGQEIFLAGGGFS